MIFPSVNELNWSAPRNPVALRQSSIRRDCQNAFLIVASYLDAPLQARTCRVPDRKSSDSQCTGWSPNGRAEGVDFVARSTRRGGPLADV